MRRLFPLIVILFAISLYATRETTLHPFSGVEDRTLEENTPAAPMDEPLSPMIQEVFQSSLEEPEPPIITHGKIGRGSSFFMEMRKAGIPPTKIDRLVRDSRSTFNLKKVHPGQKYSVFKSQQGDLDSLSLSLSRDKFLKVRRKGEHFYAAIDTIPYNITYHVTSGVIRQSLFLALQSQGADPELAGRLSLIFGWEIDFLTDIREGDHYTILYEKKTYESGKTALGRILASKIQTRGKMHYAFGYKASGRSWSYYDLKGKSLQKSLLRAPLSYTRITSNYGWKRLNPVTRHYAPHLGVDYGAPYGTPVKSTGDGTVVAATRGRANGNYVKIRHNRSYTTYYLHLSKFAKGIRNGTKVRQGQVIGYVGSTGYATGPHLDYRIKVGNRFVNPRTIDLPSKNPVPENELPIFAKVRDAYLVKFLEGASRGEEGKTILVEEPSLQNEDQLPILF